MKKIAWCFFTCLLSLCARSQWTTSGTNIYNSNTGNVGVGLTTPIYPFHIQGKTSGASRNLYIQNSSGMHCFSVTDAGDAYVNSSVICAGITMQSPVSANMSFFTSGSTTPSLIFYSYGGADGSNYSQIGNHSAGIALDTRANMPPFKINTAVGGVVTEALSVFLNNHIGIGVNSVDNGSLLQVNGNFWATGFKLPTGAAAGKVLTSDASGTATWQTPTGGSGSGWALNGNSVGAVENFGTADNNALPIITNNIERMRITADGKVAIGTSDPQGYQLAVNGSAIFTKVKVKAFPWPDYVFKKNFQLPSLPQLEAYVREHHHLPGVASEAEVMVNGIDVGENEAALLKKVEELTLYLIEEHKQRQKQEQVNAGQEARLNAQQQEIEELRRMILSMTKHQ